MSVKQLSCKFLRSGITMLWLADAQHCLKVVLIKRSVSVLAGWRTTVVTRTSGRKQEEILFLLC